MKLKKSMFKNITREITAFKTRFFLLLVIIILGCSLFVGLKSTVFNMNKLIQTYYKDTNIMDIKLSSNIGFTEENFIKIKNLEEVKGIMLTKSIDAKTSIKNKTYNIKVSSINKLRSNKNDDYINRLVLTKGKYPSTINEGLVEESFLTDNDLSIGSLITLTLENNNYLKAKKIKITGTVRDSYYMSKQRGKTLSGKEDLNYYIYLDNNDFNIDYYTEAYITLKNSNNYNIYDSKYSSYVQQYKDEILNTVSVVQNERHDYITSDLTRNITTIENSLNEIYNLQLPEKSIGESIKALSEQLNIEKENKEKIENLEITSLTKEEIPSFLEYKSEITKIQNITEFFSHAFLFMTIIIISLFISKLINSQKKEIKILKNIGYNKLWILFKYVFYDTSVYLIGSLLGSFIFSKLITYLVILRFNSYYELPFIFPFVSKELVILTILFTTLISIIITIINFYVVENKEVILQKLKRFRCKKINLKLNLKKITLILIFGISSSLILTLVNLINTGANTINEQYKKIDNSILTINLKNNITVDEYTKIEETLNQFSINYSKISSTKIKVIKNNTIKTANLIVSNDYKNYNNIYKIKDINNNFVSIEKNELVISQKLAKELNVKKYDYILLDNYNKKVKVKNVVNDYLNNYIYVTPKYYENLTNKKVNYNIIIIKENANVSSLQSICINKNVKSCLFNDTFSSNLKEELLPFKNINLILILFTIILEILFLILLFKFNLNKKESKVLKNIGFSKFCCFIKVTIKDILFIIIGTLIGLLLGSFTSILVTKSCSNNLILFNLEFNISNYLITIIITLLPVFIINLFYFITKSKDF